jgi:DNA-binding helix-hairpin-helix protein with protein kinase domain
MTLYLPNGRPIQLSDSQLGSGGEGLVFRLRDTDDLCAKIYLDPPAGTRDRLTAMMRAAPATWGGDHAEHLHVAWPREVLLDSRGVAHGFLMPLVEGEPLTKLFDPRMRLSAVDEPTWRVVIVVAARVARLLAKMHAAGIVMGDIKPANMLLSRTGHVTLIDCDTVQFTDPASLAVHRCSKLTPGYCPPEMTGNGANMLEPSHDDFGLAILVCQMLMEGEHPFEGVPADVTASDYAAQDNIALQNNRRLFPERFLPVRDAISPDVLPPEVRELARRCFGDGHRDSACRPSAQEWADVLDRAGFQLMGCRHSERHLYHQSLSSCVWCDRAAAGGGDHYPTALKIVIPQPVAAQGQREDPTMTAWVPPAPTPHGEQAPLPAPASTRAKVAKVVGWVVAILIVIILVLSIVEGLS